MIAVMRDLIIILGDVTRLCEGLMHRTLETPGRAVKQTIKRLIVCVALCTASLILAGTGTAFILGGLFVLLARAMNSPGVAALIIGFAVLLIATVVAIVGRSLVSRR